MSAPISASSTSAVRRLTPGIVISNASNGEQGAATRASSASTWGSLVPCTSASSIARPETPSGSLATLASLIPASSSTLCSRWTSRVRSASSALR
jgi:hypothetical protein